MKKCYSLFIALLPLISLYQLPLLNVNAGLFAALCFSGVHALFIVFGDKKEGSTIRRLPLLFHAYIVLSGLLAGLLIPSAAGQALYFRIALFLCITIPALWAVSTDLFDLKFLRTVIEKVALFAGGCIVIQYICYYVFGRTLGTGRVWLLPFPRQLGSAYYMGKSMLEDGLFRPSAFFLEPAHFSQYVIVALVSCLMPGHGDKMKTKQAVFLSLCMLLSTSGMGIVLAIFAWVYVLLAQNLRMTPTRRRVMMWTAAAGITLTFFVLSRFEFFNAALGRILSDGSGGENAYAGRLYTSHFYESLEGLARWIGMGFQNVPVYTEGIHKGSAYYMVGMVEMLYCLGIAGVAVFLMVMADAVRLTKDFSRCVALIYLVIFLSASRLKTVDVVFFLSMVYAGYAVRQEHGKPLPLYRKSARQRSECPSWRRI